MNKKTCLPVRQAIRTIAWVGIFSIAMAFLETAIVIYLRKLYYPEGFSFPLIVIDFDIAVTEFLRELATLVMLAGIGVIAGKKNIERFAYFIFSFAVWDIFYYAFLKVILNWPESFLTWDILFLIPTVWVGPVLAPLINSLTMILLAFCIIYFVENKGKALLNLMEWTLLIAGSVLVIFAYTREFSAFLLAKYSLPEIFDFSNKNEIIDYACSYIPVYFNWWIFLAGELMHVVAITSVILRNKKIPAGI
ncbi:MAG: hypothetical protein V1904_02760 [Bacteroidota bacterium]